MSSEAVEVVTGQQSCPDPDELAMLREAAAGLFADDKTTLRMLGDLGLLGLLTPQQTGGSGWRPIEAVVVAEEAGRALTGIAWAANLIAAATATDPGAEADADGLMAGTMTAATGRSASLTVQGSGSTGSGGTGSRITVSGTVAVTGHPNPDVLVVFDPAGGVFVVPATNGAVQLLPEQSPLDTTRGGATATLLASPARLVSGEAASRLTDAAILLACADALGALSRTAHLVREHLVARSAFGRPIASFQVIQHRLADLAVVEAASSALVQLAARTMAASPATSGQAVSAAHAYFATHVTAALDDCIQLAGGIGFTWEWPGHHAMRRALAGNSFARLPADSLAKLVVGVDDAAAGDEGERRSFREHVRTTIRMYAPFEAREGHRAPTTPEQEAALRSWYRRMYETGLLGGPWPVERGGRADHHPMDDLIVTEELIRARAPRPIDQVQLASHVLLHFGSDEQKDRYLPRIRSGTDIWCQLFSEPDAGSDLAGIKARAECQPDGSWLLSGQKTWTTDGQWAQMGLALLRTEKEGRRHHGITAFAVPMDAPGLEIRPKLTIGGAYEFNDVFLDGVILDGNSVIGPLGGGWGVAMSGLEVERFGVGGNVVLLEMLLDDLRALAEGIVADGIPLIDHRDVRRDIAALVADAFAARAFVSGHIERTLAGRDQPSDASIAKLLHTEAYNRIARFGAEIASAQAPLPDPAKVHGRRLTDAWLWSRALTISGGSSEIMRNIIAKRRLLLPQ